MKWISYTSALPGSDAALTAPRPKGTLPPDWALHRGGRSARGCPAGEHVDKDSKSKTKRGAPPPVPKSIVEQELAKIATAVQAMDNRLKAALKEAAEDRRQAAEDRRQAEEDRRKVASLLGNNDEAITRMAEQITRAITEMAAANAAAIARMSAENREAISQMSTEITAGLTRVQTALESRR